VFEITKYQQTISGIQTMAYAQALLKAGFRVYRDADGLFFAMRLVDAPTYPNQPPCVGEIRKLLENKD
jgi:hypothetical protein